MADAGRVIAGSARGIRLRAPGDGTRPMGDRVKQTLFAILEPQLRGARVLDLFAGSGGGGIEALSRGASACWFLERDASAVRVIADNLERAGLAGPAATVVRADAIEWLSRTAPEVGPFDIILVDPPYAQPDLLVGALRRLGDGGAAAILAPAGVVVAKHFWRSGPPADVGLLASDRERRFGETALTFYRRPAPGTEGR